MTNKELKKLNRADLIAMLLEVSRENRQLREELEQTRQQLENKTIAIENVGSLADAAMQLNGVFEAAEDACAQYARNLQERSGRIQQMCDQMEQQTREKCRKMLEQTKREADAYWEFVRGKVREQYQGGTRGAGIK